MRCLSPAHSMTGVRPSSWSGKGTSLRRKSTFRQQAKKSTSSAAVPPTPHYKTYKISFVKVRPDR
ncbi:hypothetical protein BJX63DRAFT_308408 [Aspergillus granulosus]|uniref:Uncharacterized protein n=1 Tax=Aspergillus granulosus TaxID=176169 RepID=A0ABR4H5G3_9EURO